MPHGHGVARPGLSATRASTPRNPTKAKRYLKHTRREAFAAAAPKLWKNHIRVSHFMFPSSKSVYIFRLLSYLITFTTAAVFFNVLYN